MPLVGKPASGLDPTAAGLESTPGARPSDDSSRSVALVQPGSAVPPTGGVKSIVPSPSLSSPSAQAGVGSGSPSVSLLSMALLQPGSAVSPSGGTKSVNPSPSSSKVLEHSGSWSASSWLSVALVQSGSAVSPTGGAKSTSPSPSSSIPLAHSAVRSGAGGITGRLEPVSAPGGRLSATAVARSVAERVGPMVAAEAGDWTATTAAAATSARTAAVAVRRRGALRDAGPPCCAVAVANMVHPRCAAVPPNGLRGQHGERR